MNSVIATGQQTASVRATRFRWWICALLFFATTINYVDRQVLSVLAPDLQRELGWTEIEYGYIVTTFQLSYAVGLLVVGKLMDKIGIKTGFALAIVIWSLASMLHGLVGTVLGFALARLLLGIGESGNFPASLKVVSAWFPPQERALATGIFNSGANIGAILAPFAVPLIALHWGWQWAFILSGLLGFIWLIAWLVVYQKPNVHPRVNAPELAVIQRGEPTIAQPIRWTELIRSRHAWAIAIGKFLTDPIWWFFLYWLPKFLHQSYELNLQTVGLPLVTAYLIADAGSIGGGWLSSFFIRKGWSVNAARKTTLLICAVMVVPVFWASGAREMWVAVAFIGLGMAAHTAWSANMYTLVTDMFPQPSVGSVIGFVGMAGAVGGMLMATATGYLLEWTGSYTPLFVIAASTYGVALLLIHWLVPRITPYNTRRTS